MGGVRLLLLQSRACRLGIAGKAAEQAPLYTMHRLPGSCGAELARLPWRSECSDELARLQGYSCAGPVDCLIFSAYGTRTMLPESGLRIDASSSSVAMRPIS